MNAGDKLKDMISKSKQAGIDPKPGFDTKQIYKDRAEFEQVIKMAELEIQNQIQDGVFPNYRLEGSMMVEDVMLAAEGKGKSADILNGMKKRLERSGIKPVFTRQTNSGTGDPYVAVTVEPVG